jgi:hypothetical protein
MKNYLINYATPSFFSSQLLNAQSGLAAGFSSVLQWRKEDIDSEFSQEHFSILKQSRGGGYWLWKPYFILKTLEMIKDGDCIFYSDSGAVFSRQVEPLLKTINDNDDGVVCFRLAGPHHEGGWTRRHVLQSLDMDNEEIRRSKQHMASFLMVKKTGFSVDFITTWLELCKDPLLLTDSVKEKGIDNFPEFQEHRHDQSLLSLLIKKHQIELAPDPTQWGVYHKETTEEDVYFDHHRNAKSTS